MRGLIFCLLLFVVSAGYAQNAANQVDAQGRKQGFWIKKDREGRKVYEATFKNDKPVGEMKRFHPNGKVMALMDFVAGTDTAVTQMFDEQGNLVAKGKYAGQKKTGEWIYFLKSKLISTEDYADGQKNGPSKRYYTTGEILEESNWRNGHLDGMYRAFFRNGKPYMECSYADGQRNGPFKIWTADGTPELEAGYFDDARDKDWKYFDESGNIQFTLKFDKGKLLNPEVQDSIDRLKFESFKQKGNNIPDPEKFMQDPEQYMQLMQNR